MQSKEGKLMAVPEFSGTSGVRARQGEEGILLKKQVVIAAMMFEDCGPVLVCL